MKRFYKAASVVELAAGYSVQLDGRDIKTPAKAELVVPTRMAADLVAADWNAQGDEVLADKMVHARLANTAIDRVAGRRDSVIDEIAAYGGSDLVCYRADHPAALVARQAQAWDPFLAFARESLGVSLKVTSGIMHVAQDPSDLKVLRSHVAALSDHQLSAFFGLTTGLGSLVLAFGLTRRVFAFDTVFQASQIDGLFQEEQWGFDAEADAARATLRADLEATLDYYYSLD